MRAAVETAQISTFHAMGAEDDMFSSLHCQFDTSVSQRPEESIPTVDRQSIYKKDAHHPLGPPSETHLVVERIVV